MKKIYLAVIAVMSVISCTREQNVTEYMDNAAGESAGGTVELVFPDNPMTKGTPVHPDWESAVSRLEVIFFHVDGSIYRYRAFSGKDLKSATVKNVREGTYRIAVVANAPASLNLKSLLTVDELHRKTLSLGDNRRDTAMVMLTSSEFAEKTWNVADKQTTVVEAVLERPASRVTLSNISNASAVAVTIESVMLTNVADTIVTDGTNCTWINRQGRADENPRVQDHIIGTGTYKASYESLTFNRIGVTLSAASSYGTVLYFYGNANASTGEPAGFTPSFPASGEKTCMVVTAVMDGKRCYYPIVLDELKAGMSYDCQLKIVGKGSDDPDVPVKTDNLSFTVTMKTWSTSHTYDDNI